MNFGLVRWMRRVLPRGDLPTAMIVVEMLIECVYLWNQWQFGFADEDMFRMTRFAWLCVCATLYGMYRIIAFHPLTDPEYREWLEQTPWTADKPLPVGPLQLVPQDLVIVLVMALLYRTPSMWMLYFPTAFIVGYQIMLAVCARVIGHWGIAYVLGFGLSFVFLFVERPEAAFAAADACFVIGRFAVSIALRTFPWGVPWQVNLRTYKAITEEGMRRRLGWPHDQIRPATPERVIPIHDGVCISLLLGWWWFILLTHLIPEVRFALPGLIIMPTAGFAIYRIANYVMANRPPISFFGRIFTFRWIIIGYDKIYVAPFLAFIGAAAFQGSAMHLLNPGGRGFIANPAVNPLLGMAISAIGVTVSAMLLLVAGPVLEVWRLTGRHRVVFDLAAFEKVQKKDQFVEL